MNWLLWTLLWVALALGTLAMLGWGLLHLWRVLRRALDGVGQATQEISNALSAEGDPTHSLTAAQRHGTPVGWDAAFGDPAQVRAQRAFKRDERVEARRERRVDRLWSTGRPRRWGDIDHAEL